MAIRGRGGERVRWESIIHLSASPGGSVVLSPLALSPSLPLPARFGTRAYRATGSSVRVACRTSHDASPNSVEMGSRKQSGLGLQGVTPFALFLPSAIIIASAALVHACLPGGALHAWVDVPPAHTKPYDSDASFYPHYLAEHSLLWTRRLHYLGTSLFVAALLRTPTLLLCLFSAASAGYAVSPLVRAHPTGAVEALVLVGVYMLTASLLVGSARKALTPVAAAYAFAWIAHFFVENNRPATFIYPTYSLMVGRVGGTERLEEGRGPYLTRCRCEQLQPLSGQP